MQKLLNQDEIDAMVRAARGSKGSVASAREAKVTVCDFRQAGQLNRDQVKSIAALHETFARNLTDWLAAYLRVGFKCSLVSVEQLTFGEMLSRMPDQAYFSLLLLQPSKSLGALQLELTAAFPVIDLLLGGPGHAGPQRDLTTLEEQVLEDAVRIICRELGTAWKDIGVTFEVESRLQPERLQRLFPATETTLALSFEIRIAESQGLLNLIVPGTISDALLHRLAQEDLFHRPRAEKSARRKLMETLQRCAFPAELVLKPLRLPARELLDLAPGKVLKLPYPTDSPAVLRVGGQDTFQAGVVRRELIRAAHLGQALAESPSQEKA